MTRFGNENEIDVHKFADLFNELDQQKRKETDRWKERIGSMSGTYQVQSEKQENTVHTIRVEVPI